jgi:hypothetical protein
LSDIGGDGTFRTRLDYLNLIETDTPNRITTWGSVKAIFRDASR